MLYSGRRSPGVLKQNTILRADVVRRFPGVLKYSGRRLFGGPSEFLNKTLCSIRRSGTAPLMLRSYSVPSTNIQKVLARRWCGGNSVAITYLQGTPEELRVTPLHCVAIDFFNLRNRPISSQSPTNLSALSEVVRRSVCLLGI